MLSQATPCALWHDSVREAVLHLDTALDEALESYLVMTLMAYTQTPLSGHVAEQFLASNQELLIEENLRDVGDRCLLMSGLFPEHAKSRLVSEDYYPSIGRTAYATVAERTNMSQVALFEDLSASFMLLSRTLRAMRPNDKPRIHEVLGPHKFEWL